MNVDLARAVRDHCESSGCDTLLIDAVSGGDGSALVASARRMTMVRMPLNEPGLPLLLAMVERHRPSRELHLVCPGDCDCLLLGTSVITLHALQEEHEIRGALAAVGASLAGRTSVVIGGANVGRGERGHAFLQALADLLRVEVSALVRLLPSH